ncbi:MAG: hypothetical protein QXR26_07285 [Candidatus Caldarchaeum sp.]
MDDRFKARLEPGAYNGPRELIKKGSEFKARVLFRRVDGVLNVSVKDVVSV